MSNSLRPHESQHARPPCPSPTPGVHPDSCPSSQWCHPAISSSVIPFSSCPQSLPASESLPMSQHFSWGGQSTGLLVKPLFFFFFNWMIFAMMKLQTTIYFKKNLLEDRSEPSILEIYLMGENVNYELIKKKDALLIRGRSQPSKDTSPM